MFVLICLVSCEEDDTFRETRWIHKVVLPERRKCCRCSASLSLGMGCTCDRPLSGRPCVPLKLLPKCIIRWLQVHCIQQEVFSAIWMHRKSQFSKFCALICRCFLIDSRASRRWNLEITNSVSTLRIFFSSDMMKIAGGHCRYYGWMRHISPLWERKLQALRSLGGRKSSRCASMTLYDRYVTVAF